MTSATRTIQSSLLEGVHYGIRSLNRDLIPGFQGFAIEMVSLIALWKPFGDISE